MHSYKNQLALFEIVVISHSVFDNVNAALVSIRDFFGGKKAQNKNHNYSDLLIGI